MTLKSCLAPLGLVFAFVLPFGSAQAATAECQAKSTQSGDAVASLKAAQGCDAAMKVFQVCQYGASADVEFGAVVEKKCEADFLDKADASKQQVKRRLGLCEQKYRNKSGTMYISFTAFCRAQAAQRYSQQMRKAAGAK